MLKIILTLDYEIHGNGEGHPRELMLEPTLRLLRLCDDYGAKLTIMADAAELLKFKEYKETRGRDDYCYDALAEQLRSAVGSGHDVQLHLHSSYFNARHEAGAWKQHWPEYDFAGLPYERMAWMVGTGKRFLEALLQPAAPGYRCSAFRAANWSVSPSANVVRALADNGISIDTSVFKYGRRSGLVSFDYSRAYSPLLPWRASGEDICARDDAGRLWELPIYSERRWIGAFLTAGRLYRAALGRRHALRGGNGGSAPVNGEKNGADAVTRRGLAPSIVSVFRRHAWKADFNQCAGTQLIRAVRRAADRYGRRDGMPLPFVLIGHSKLFTKHNERGLGRFLAHAARSSDTFGFDTLAGMQRCRAQWEAL